MLQPLSAHVLWLCGMRPLTLFLLVFRVWLSLGVNERFNVSSYCSPCRPLWRRTVCPWTSSASTSYPACSASPRTRWPTCECWWPRLCDRASWRKVNADTCHNPRLLITSGFFICKINLFVLWVIFWSSRATCFQANLTKTKLTFASVDDVFSQLIFFSAVWCQNNSHKPAVCFQCLTVINFSWGAPVYS